MKKILLVAMMAMLVASGMRAQGTSDSQVYDKVEVMPQYPGGMQAMMQFMAENVKYPAQAAKEKIEGKVSVQFIVEKDGSISNVQTVAPVHPLLDAEAIRVVKAMPKWAPGKVKGENVRVKFVMPVMFKQQ